MPVINQNRIVTKTCPVCGVSRPLDWFGQEQKLVDYKKDGTVRKVVRYRKKYQPQINLADGGKGIKSAFLRVSGFYFSGREAISFNEDGFIGIAGWADDTNVQPFLRAFHKWVCEWMIGVTYR